MDQSLKEWFDEYGRLSDALRPYSDRITRKIFGPTAPQELTEPEHVFERLHYYWSAALVNAGDVFGYVPFIIENRAGFTAIGADGTLAALERLMPFYRQQEQLRDDAEKNEYWRRTREERASAEDLAEGVHEFARLLLAYAEKNLPPPNEK